MITTATNMTVGDLVSRLRNGKLIPKPDFQRRLVWQNKDKISFLDTVLKEYPFPEIYIAADTVDTATGETIYQLVDGQQRITALAQYMNASSDLKLSGGILPYQELTQGQKQAFVQYKVVVRDLGSIGRDEIVEVFKRINSTGYSLNPIEIQNAVYEGELKKFAENVAQHEFFTKRNVFSAQEGRRMLDVNFALSLIATIIKGYFNRNKMIETVLNDYNDEFSQKDEIQSNLDRVFEIIESCNLLINSRVWGKADLFTLIVELYDFIIRKNNNPDYGLLGQKLNEFYFRVDSDLSRQGTDKKGFNYYQNALQAANDRTSRIERGNILKQEVLETFLNTDQNPVA